MSHRGRQLTWYGGGGVAIYDDVEVGLRQKPHVPGLREFVELLYEPSRHKCQLKLRNGHKVDMKAAERAAIDSALDRMTRLSRGAFDPPR